MKLAIPLATVFAAVLASATPTNPPAPSNYDTAYVTFLGATNDVNDRYKVAVPTDGTVVYISNRLSVSYMSSYAGPDVKCTARGIDGSKTVTKGSQVCDFGPHIADASSMSLMLWIDV